ncbi:ABC transporter ATP-binding protein [Falsibacillus pallidus]|uniref:ABC transporter ATP-binding protein n=1 Tax=Falsibacillus pallidus TaxID=493781 RepID=UPI003D98DA78
MKKPMIEFHNFSFKYRSQAQPTLHDVNLTIYEGEKVLIAGPSGSGKSTLAHCINGLVPLYYRGDISGSLKVMGKETKELDIFSISKMVGTVLQDSDAQFIGLSVAEDMAFALENEALPQKEMIERVEDIARMVEMDQFLHHSIHQLSGGQKQRVGLGGVMVNNAQILLFDEPLANLDPATGKYAMQLIERIRQECSSTIVIIEHRIEDVLDQNIDRIILMNEGRIVMDASPEEILCTNILNENGIREPLYIKALKQAGCPLLPAMNPQHIHSLELDAQQKGKLVQWAVQPMQKPTLKKAAPLLELEDIQFQYENGKPIIQNLSLSVHKGEMVSIIGKNGAGKSTLTKLICGFLKPSAGRILLNGRDIRKDTIKERALKIGLVLQNPNAMISKNMIMDEVSLGLAARGINKEEITKRVDSTLKICGLHPYRNWPVSALSYGQKKRVTIASILALAPDILILDEPTAGQDYQHYKEIMDFLVELNARGTTIILITHDMHLMLEYTPRAIVLADGEKIADGAATQVLREQEVIKRANLKETSLYLLAEKAGIINPDILVERFIASERGVPENAERNAVIY